MPFLAPSFARLLPLDYLLAGQVEARQKVARNLGLAGGPCSATRPAATRRARCTWPSGSRAAGVGPPSTRRPTTQPSTPRLDCVLGG